MAKDKKTPKITKSGPTLWQRLLKFFQSEHFRFIMGLFFLLVATFAGLAFCSFFITGKADQALIENQTWSQITSLKNGTSNWMGSLGAFMADVCINRWMGVSVFLFVYFLLLCAFRLMKNESLKPMAGKFISISLWSIWLSMALGFVFVSGYNDTYLYLGGKHGYDLAAILEANIGGTGVILLIIVSFIILCVFVSSQTIYYVRRLFEIWPRWQAYRNHRREKARLRAEQAAAERAAREAEEALADTTPVPHEAPVTPQEPTPVQDVLTDPDDTYDLLPEEEVQDCDTLIPAQSEPANPTVQPDVPVSSVEDPAFEVTTNRTDTVDEPLAPQEDYDPTADLAHYNFPTFSLLKQYEVKDIPIDMDEQTANKEKIKKTLHDYGIEIQSISATVGPTITLFEIVPVEGTRIVKIRNLQDEIAMSIAATTGIRIIAPIPGKTAIGIEVPNRDPQVVSMHSVITSRAFQESTADLPVALGKTITNEVFTFDLAKMPHLLVAGATGQGKSVGLNAIITSLLYKKHPSQLKMVLIDPKQVEFSIYSRIEKHFLAKLPDEEEPIITDVSKVVATLNSVCIEMDNRYTLLKEAGLRNIKEYNDRFVHRKLNPKKGHKYLPYIVVIVDEYGDLIMTAGKEIELPIARIAQKARAVGIHMIIATQRPSAKIITGIIKTNFPARIAFRVGQGIDSGIIIDQPGAQHLIGRGDLLFAAGNMLERVQCAFVDTPEVDRINRYVADQQSYPTAFILPEPPIDPAGDGSGSGEVDLNRLDPMFAEAAELVVSTGQGSTSMIQRKFSIGYNRAGRIVDQLEAAGIVGPFTGSKARAVLVDSETELLQILQDLKNR